ncbi:MAG: T9SS type A sorting domain-containing protein [Bacteroidetes bacterium]|nr:T9SS type A sorting domain-containing protein [Bacteroidota bacterium]
MKKAYTTLFVSILLSFSVFGQTGFLPNFFGDFYKRDLTNPSNAILIGTTQNQIGASDFSSDGVLYAISGADNGLYILDTTDATATFITSITPSGSEFWTGMANDPTDGTMYVCSTDGNSSTFYTLDLETGATTIIGSGMIEDGVTGIAFDDTGQMFAIFLVRKFYSIDKTNGQATYIGDFNMAVSGLPHHGLDFDPETQTMFMVSYNVFELDNELWTVDLTTGANTLVGSVDIWTGTIAVRPPVMLTAGFTANATEICEDEIINFTDESMGNPDSWLWTFEGGDPATSTDQNPVVAYTNEGQYDVTLEVSNGSGSNTVTMTDYISVFGKPTPEVQGPETVCAGHAETYSTLYNEGNTYDWEVSGGEIISGAGTSEIVVEWGAAGEGTVVVTESSPECEGTSAIFEVLIDPCTGIETNFDWQQRLYPNPAQKEIILDVTDMRANRLTILDSKGQSIFYQTLSKTDVQIRIDISSFTQGLYFLCISANDGNDILLKFVKSE